ncbi:MAG: glycosyltransferase, partial [Acidobacteriota bacterium]|nr:glycosyltransferase [Acidobacteriota bacterium]
MRKLKVLEMIDRPSLGGGQVHVLSLAKSLEREKFDVSVCSRGGGPLVDELRKLDIPHAALPVFKRPSLRARREMAGILKRGNFDILHTHGGVAGFHGRPAGRSAGTPVIVHTLHGIHYLHYGSALLRRASVLLERRFSRFTDCVVCVSERDLHNATEFKLAPPEKLKLVQNGIDVSGLVRPFDPAAKKAELGLDPCRPLDGTVARLHRQKGLASLIRASRKIGEHV